MKFSLIICLVVGLLVFGCISPVSNQATFEEFNELKDEYGVVNSFSPNISIMNDYISDISELRARSSFNLATVIDAEIYSAKSFYYYSIANQKTSLVLGNCSQNQRIEIQRYFRFARDNSDIAINKIDLVLFVDGQNLRENQRELMQEINDYSINILREINSIC